METKLEHQDWNTVYVHLKKKPENKNANKVKKYKGKSNNLDEVDQTSFKNTKVSNNFCKEMCKNRNSLGLTQKDLAQKINVRPSVINDYESGKAIPDSKVLNKIKRELKMFK